MITKADVLDIASSNGDISPSSLAPSATFRRFDNCRENRQHTHLKKVQVAHLSIVNSKCPAALTTGSKLLYTALCDNYFGNWVVG
jgi:hypothetical protein